MSSARALRQPTCRVTLNPPPTDQVSALGVVGLRRRVRLYLDPGDERPTEAIPFAIDSGASYSLISLSLAEDRQLPVPPPEAEIDLRLRTTAGVTVMRVRPGRVRAWWTAGRHGYPFDWPVLFRVGCASRNPVRSRPGRRRPHLPVDLRRDLFPRFSLRLSHPRRHTLTGERSYPSTFHTLSHRDRHGRSSLSLACLFTVFLAPRPSSAQYPPLDSKRPIDVHDSVFIEELTWMEVRDALKAGKKTVIVPDRRRRAERAVPGDRQAQLRPPGHDRGHRPQARQYARRPDRSVRAGREHRPADRCT